MSNLKQVTVTFDFDVETSSVSNVQCVVDGVEKKKRTTKKKSEVEEVMASEAIVVLEPNKLVFNNKAVADMELEVEDRVIIKWEKDKKNKKMIPTIGKDIAFDEIGAGNKVTKSFTVICKGKANAILSEVGNEFTLETFSEGVWKLIPTKGSVAASPKTLEQVIVESEETEVDLLVDTDDTTAIDEISFKL